MRTPTDQPTIGSTSADVIGCGSLTVVSPAARISDRPEYLHRGWSGARCAARGQHRRLDPPTHRHPRTRRAAGRSRRPRRPSHDRHPATQADPGAGPPDPPRRCAHPAPTTGVPPARRGPRPPPRTPSNPLTRPHGPEPPGPPPTRGDTRALSLPRTRKPLQNDRSYETEINSSPTRGFGSESAPPRSPRAGAAEHIAEKRHEGQAAREDGGGDNWGWRWGRLVSRVL